MAGRALSRTVRISPWLCVLAVATALAPAGSPRPLARTGRLDVRPGHLRGALHVHTARSEDARGSIEEVAEAAARAGLSFVVVTDHNSAADQDESGYRHGVLIVVGSEKSTEAGHALVLGTGRLPFGLDGEPAAVVRDVADLGGFVVAAHPRGHDPWGGGTDGLAGLEVLNLADRQNWPAPGPAVVITYARLNLDPVGTLLRSFRASRASLSLWDTVLLDHPAAGLLGSDAHGGIRVGRTFLPRPTHLDVFRMASQHLLLPGPLTGAAAADQAAVLEAIRQGRGWAAFDGLGDASSFTFTAEMGSRSAGMGESLPLDGPPDAAVLRADVDVPGAELVLLRDGKEVARGASLAFRTETAGVYRVEGYLRGSLRPDLPWIVSNPIALFAAAELQAREARAHRLPPEPAPLAVTLQALDRFDEPRLAPAWQIDRSPDASGRLGLESGALRFDFTLGPGRSTHVAACQWAPRDLGGARALGFRVRASRPLRLDVQVRTIDPASPGGVRIWRQSARAGLGWREVTVPLADLTSYDHHGGRPDLRHVQGLYFHVDEANLPPGSTGTLWIDDFRTGG